MLDRPLFRLMLTLDGTIVTKDALALADIPAEGLELFREGFPDGRGEAELEVGDGLIRIQQSAGNHPGTVLGSYTTGTVGEEPFLRTLCLADDTDSAAIEEFVAAVVPGPHPPTVFADLVGIGKRPLLIGVQLTPLPAVMSGELNDVDVLLAALFLLPPVM